jgi:hypothetical protein
MDHHGFPQVASAGLSKTNSFFLLVSLAFVIAILAAPFLSTRMQKISNEKHVLDCGSFYVSASATNMMMMLNVIHV